MYQRIHNSLIDLIDSLIEYPKNRTGKLLNNILLILFLLFGLVLWIRFLNFGDLPFNRLDWSEITFPRLSILQQAIINLQIPLHTAQPDAIKGVTDRFLTLPDLILSPDIVLLKIMPIKNFIILHLFLTYSIGFWGLLRFRNRFKISFTAFTPLFFLYNFNGFIISHLTVGHLTWTAYFLMVFWVDLILDIFEPESLNWKWVTKFSLFQFALFLLGGYHFFVWILMYNGILFILIKKNRKFLFFGLVFSFLINCYRIFPAILLSNELTLDFHTSFPTFYQIIKSLIIMINPYDMVISKDIVDVRLWEINFYVGLLGFLFIFVLGVLFYIKPIYSKYRILTFSNLLFVLISLGNYYKPLFYSGIPILSGERVTTRFLILPIIVTLFLSTIYFQSLINTINKRNYGYPILWVGILILANDLSQNMSNWGINELVSILSPIKESSELAIMNHPDPIYTGLLISGLVVTIFFFIFLLYKFSIKMKRNNESF